MCRGFQDALPLELWIMKKAALSANADMAAFCGFRD